MGKLLTGGAAVLAVLIGLSGVGACAVGANPADTGYEAAKDVPGAKELPDPV